MWKDSRYNRGKRYNRIRFWPNAKYIKGKYLEVYKGIQSAILNTTGFDENSDLSTTYLGKSDRSMNDKIKVEESFPILE